MESSAGPSDVEVLDDLLYDVDGQNFEDAEAFFDMDGDQDGGGVDDAATYDILTQLDAVTTLDDDEVQADTSEEFHDSTSAPPLPNDTEKSSPLHVDGNTKEQAQSSEDVVQAVLDLTLDADAEYHDKNAAQSAVNELDGTQLVQEQESSPPKSEIGEERSRGEEVTAEVSASDSGEIALAEILDAVVVADDDADNMIETREMPPFPLVNETTSEDKKEASQSTSMPPPAPTLVHVVVGTMNPLEDGDDDSDESQGEEDAETIPLRSRLRLGNEDEEDEDVLEVNTEVVSSLQIEEKQRQSMRAQTTEQQPSLTKKIDDSAAGGENELLKALPNCEVGSLSAIDVSFSEEVRVAHVTTLEPNSPFSDIHRMAGSSKPTQPSAEDTFGISYQSMRKKAGESFADENEERYSLPSGPAFPDEREFENEMELTSDLSFSVAISTSPSRGDESTINVDDEFSFDDQPAVESKTLSEAELKALRESLEAKKRKDEDALVKELKRATDEEKRLLTNAKAADTIQVDSATTATNEVAADSEAVSLTELHSMYKRGLGDQGVLMDEEIENGATKEVHASEVGRSMSVMGRIFSQTHGATDTIKEEADGDGSEGADSPKAGDANAEDTKTITEKNEAEEAEWREIKLVQHRQAHECEESELSAAANVANSPETASRISYAEAAGYYAEIPDVMQHRDIIVSEDFPRGSCLTCLSRPRLTFAGAIEERDRVFCIAATAFDAHNDVIVSVLQTIYKKVTKTHRDVLLIGRHWEDIGFQGTDPSTDLRGCGVLSLLQILYLVESHPDLTQRFHALSQHPTRHFPFACVLINITLQCVVALRGGALYTECNKHTSVLTGMNRLYVALASQLHDAIQSRSDEIPLIMKDILDRGRLNPNKVIDEAFDGTALRPPRPAAAPSKLKTAERKESDNNLEFTEIGLQSVDDEE